MPRRPRLSSQSRHQVGDEGAGMAVDEAAGWRRRNKVGLRRLQPHAQPPEAEVFGSGVRAERGRCIEARKVIAGEGTRAATSASSAVVVVVRGAARRSACAWPRQTGRSVLQSRHGDPVSIADGSQHAHHRSDRCMNDTTRNSESSIHARSALPPSVAVRATR
jgi:hypothetical protein